QVRIPAVSQILGAQPPYPPNRPVRVMGIYDGTPWTIIDDPAQFPTLQTGAILDTGTKAEPVIVKLMPNSFDPTTKTATVILEGTGPGGLFLFQHWRGAPLRLLTADPFQRATMPGNPGPQPGFQFRAIQYAPVVRYAEQTQ